MRPVLTPIRMFRLRMGLTQRELALLANVPGLNQSKVSRIELGVQPASPEELEAFEKVFSQGKQDAGPDKTR